jgi:hypothetical protein
VFASFVVSWGHDGASEEPWAIVGPSYMLLRFPGPTPTADKVRARG